MSKLQLTEHDKNILTELHRTLNKRRDADKIKAIILLGSGYDYEEVQKILLLDERTLRRYEDIFLTSNVDGLLENNYKGKKRYLNEIQEKELTKHLTENLYSSAYEIAIYIKRKYGIDFTTEGLVQTLHRMGFSYKKTKIVPAKADRPKQLAFINEYKQLRDNLDEDKEIAYFVDGVHPTHNVMPEYGWIKKGQEKEIKSNTGRERVNLHGAYSPINQDIIIDDYKTINAETTKEFFQKIVAANADKEKIYLILDNARYYHSRIIREYVENTNIELIFLPSYSPNLNLIERLWKLFKKKVLYNKYYETFDDFLTAIFYFFDNKILDLKDEVKSLMTENFKAVTA